MKKIESLFARTIVNDIFRSLIRQSRENKDGILSIVLIPRQVGAYTCMK